MKAGDTLFRVCRDNRYGKVEETGTVSILKVGRKYITVPSRYHGETQIDRETLQPKDYRDAIEFWPNEEAFQDYRERNRLWDALHGLFRNHYGPAPKNISTKQLQSACDALGIREGR